MPNGEMPSWEEWNEQLSQGQRDYSLYKVLESLNDKMHSCIKDIGVLKTEKIPNRIRSVLGGIGGGAVVFLGKDIPVGKIIKFFVG